MEIVRSHTRDRTWSLVVISLVIIGLALIVSTWRILSEHHKITAEHMNLTARAVLQAVESSLRRGMMRGSPSTVDFFQELEADEDVLFISLSALDEGGRIRIRPDGEAGRTLQLPEEALKALEAGERWLGPLRVDGQDIYIAARRLTPVRHMPGMHGIHDGSALRPGVSGPSGSAGPFGAAAAPGSRQPYLVVGLDTKKYADAADAFTRAAIFQSGYILAAALALLVLTSRFFSRRALARRAAFLENFQSRLLDTLPDGLLIVEESGRIRAANPAARTLFLATEDTTPDAGGVPLDKPSPEREAPALAGSDLAATAMGKKLVPCRPTGNDLVRREIFCGKLIVEVLAQSYRDSEEERACLFILRDRTTISGLEKCLAEVEKLAAVGKLAAGVAHEIRNPLSALRGFAQYFAKKFAGKKPEEDYAATMVREADRLNRVITDLLYLSRPRRVRKSDVFLAPLAEEIDSLLRFDLAEKGVTLECDLAEPTVFADAEQLKQALINLVLNAVQALPEPGTAAASGANPGATPGTVRLRSRREGSTVVIEVTDNGPGMNDEQKKQAFEPFFTTKSKGTGLGLALVHQTVSEHGGTSTIKSAPGEGLTIRLTFPDQGTEIIPEDLGATA